MEILYLLIPLSVVLVFLIGAVFWWSVKSGQFDDLEGPGYRVIMDDDRPEHGSESDLAEQADANRSAMNSQYRREP
jgi:cbb3-type cytochrome oxidase maturation protein